MSRVPVQTQQMQSMQQMHPDGYGAPITRLNLNQAAPYGAAAPLQQGTDMHHINEIIALNVGGQHFQTFYDTVANGNSRFFSHIFRIDPSGRVAVFRQNIVEDEQGRIFINRDGRLFSYILQYLRDTSKMVLPDDVGLLKQLSREAEFFAIDRLRGMINEKVTDLEQQQNLRDERIDSLHEIVRQICQQLYVSNIKK